MRTEKLRFIKFCLVGLSGVGLGIGSLWVLTEVLGLFYIISAVVSHILSVTSNFTWNQIWTFSDRQNSNVLYDLFKRWLRFLLSTLVALGINVCVLTLLTEVFGLYYILSALCAIAVATPVNFLLSTFWVWKSPHEKVNHLFGNELDSIMKISIVVPTYNEKLNITPLIEQIGATLSGRDYEILVIDDNSPDGTAEAAAVLAKSYPVNVIKRKGVRGLGTAILEGLRNAQGNIVGVIDADLQHPPEVLDELVTAIENGNDIAVASRYISGGGIDNWSVARRIVSKGAILLARPLTQVKDPMSGCFMINTKVIEGTSFSSKGYKVLLEILVKGKYDSIEEVPYTFRERQNGKSKLGFTEYFRYIMLLIRLYFYKLI